MFHQLQRVLGLGDASKISPTLGGIVRPMVDN